MSSNNQSNNEAYIVTNPEVTNAKIAENCDPALSGCNLSLCYNSALPGLIEPNQNSGAQSSDGVISDIRDSQKPSGNSASSMAYSDPNGDVNVKISGPYNIADDYVNKIDFRVFISKENAREKWAVFKFFGLGKKTYGDDTSVTPTSAVIYSEIDDHDASKVYYFLKIRYKDLLLARGTYVVRVYQETSVGSGEYEALKVFTLTVVSDPIQGPFVNKTYIDTQNRLIRF